MNYTDEELHEAAECLVRADEINGDTDLMKALTPYMKEKMMRMDQVLSLKDLWKKGQMQLLEDDAKNEETPRLGSEFHSELVNTKDKGTDAIPKPTVPKSGQS